MFTMYGAPDGAFLLLGIVIISAFVGLLAFVATDYIRRKWLNVSYYDGMPQTVETIAGWTCAAITASTIMYFCATIK